MRNKIYNRSYFCKRIKDQGYAVKTLLSYPEEDIRQWTVLVNPNQNNFLITCYKVSTEDFWFRIESDNQNSHVEKTYSMESIFSRLEKLSNKEN
jgi:hypothetical protein